MQTCEVDDCNNLVHSKNLCQKHYRRLQKHGNASVVKVKGRKEGSTDHRKLDADEKVRRALERRGNWGSHCINGHELVPENVYTYPASAAYPGKRVCKVCRMNTQRLYKGLEPLEREIIGVWNKNKTHCAQGHQFNEENTYLKPEGSRGCKICMYSAATKSSLMIRYGITSEDKLFMYEEQNGKCAVCYEPFKTTTSGAVDHDHVTGAVRGLLCANCNNGLGRFKDNSTLLRQAADYIERYSGS